MIFFEDVTVLRLHYIYININTKSSVVFILGIDNYTNI